ncbi:sensory histidine kinase AtoS [Halolamina pelagica]|uniref:histidine kinase n=1 Tax=Halolamina pelagica TaxID=699431 RepID=A0A0P7GU34_9EURY|nr:PAS domain S-box protein [Halolamina pelagica]KPN28989.1 sensory histidine kinase AtoS [Halolamina pelagica]
MGYDEEAELIGKPVREFFVDPEAALQVMDEALETGSWEGELQAVRDDGTTFDTYCSVSYVVDDEGEPIALMASFVDITDRKRRERELAEQREKYATLVEQSHDGVAIVQNGEFVFANARLAEITEYEIDELRGRPFVDVIAPEDRQLVRERYERRLDPDADPPPSRYTLTFKTKDGSERVAEVSVADIQYEGSPAALASVRDVTERQRYEDELEQANEELEVLNRVVRHDIRNDMAVMLGWGELLEGHVDDDGAEFLEKILRSGEHIVELTETARDYVETLTTDEEVDVKPTELREKLTNEITLRREAHPQAEIRVDEPIPEIEVRANEMLPSVFRNLLNNAVQHNDKDQPIVEVGVEERADDIRVTVADNGPGVPAEQQETIFGKGEMSLDSSGTGIGLYLARTLVDQYGGDIWVEDNDPEGRCSRSRFRKPTETGRGSNSPPPRGFPTGRQCLRRDSVSLPAEENTRSGTLVADDRFSRKRLFMGARTGNGAVTFAKSTLLEDRGVCPRRAVAASRCGKGGGGDDRDRPEPSRSAALRRGVGRYWSSTFETAVGRT